MTKKKTPAELGAEIERKATETAHKIWLAGIGAYGRAFDEAKEGYGKFNTNTTDLFDDLVKRGEEIETDVRDRLNDNPYTKKTSERMNKILETSKEMREKGRERFEARMEKMRSVLGINRETSSLSTLNAKIDVLMEEVAALKSQAGKTGQAATDAAVEAVSEAADDIMDDIRIIEGIGEKTAKILSEEGFATVSALAALTEAKAEELFEKLNLAARAARENWYAQAKHIAKSR